MIMNYFFNVLFILVVLLLLMLLISCNLEDVFEFVVKLECIDIVVLLIIMWGVSELMFVKGNK